MTDRRRIKRTTADRMVGEFIDRVKAVNADQSYAYIVTRVILFGSYVNSDRDMIGDIDIGYEVKPRFSGSLWKDIERSKQSAYTAHCSIVDRLYWPCEEVLKAIRGRNRYISLHSIGIDSKAIFSDVHREIDLCPPETVELPEPVPCPRCGGTSFRFYLDPTIWIMECRSCTMDAFVESAIGIEDLVRIWNSGETKCWDLIACADSEEVEP